MDDTGNQHAILNPYAENLYNFALDREDIKWLLQGLPLDGQEDLNTVEYELQLLKIVSTGWAISFYLQEDPLKDRILEPYWQAMREFSENISQTMSLLIGKDIEYFQILKSRLETYVQAMAVLEQDSDPSQAIGPAFAYCCGDRDNPFTTLAGAKLFVNTLSSVREYLVKAVGEDEGSCNVTVQ